jgi:adenosylcobinamide kinase/adenosylcobinamide-phosphate guanylyltransferase
MDKTPVVHGKFFKKGDGMTALIIGSNGSGKSVYAEKFIRSLSAGALYYIATMIPYGEEGKKRVEKHRAQREGMAFITAEKPFNVSQISLPCGANVLLEDVSNLLGNVLFGGESGKTDSASENLDKVYADITALCGKCANAVLVSIDGLEAKPEYNEETREYINLLNLLNNRLFDFADTVIAMRDGKAHIIKGGF